MTDFNEIANAFRLSSGDHNTPQEGVCTMEAVAWLEGLEHSDRPPCTCPVIAAYVRSWNDTLPDDQRQRMIPYLPRLVGTVSLRHEKKRSEYLAWQTITVITPSALEQIGYMEHAAQLKALPYHDWDTARDAARGAAHAVANAAAHGAHATALTTAYAASAADNAANVANVARAAFYAANAAGAAAYVATADDDPWQLGFDLLDGVLSIGPAGEFSATADDIFIRTESYRELVEA